MCCRSWRPKASRDSRPRKWTSAPSLPRATAEFIGPPADRASQVERNELDAGIVGLDQVDQGLPAHHEARHGDQPNVRPRYPASRSSSRRSSARMPPSKDCQNFGDRARSLMSESNRPIEYRGCSRSSSSQQQFCSAPSPRDPGGHAEQRERRGGQGRRHLVDHLHARPGRAPRRRRGRSSAQARSRSCRSVTSRARVALVRSVSAPAPRAAARRVDSSNRAASRGSSSASSSSSTVSVSAVSRATSAAGGPLTESASSPRSARAFIPAKTAAAAKGWLATSYGVPSTGQQTSVAGQRPPARPVDVQGFVHQSRRQLDRAGRSTAAAPARISRCTRTAPAPRSGAAGRGRSGRWPSRRGLRWRQVEPGGEHHPAGPDQNGDQGLGGVEAELERDQRQQVGRASSAKSGPRRAGCDRGGRGAAPAPAGT